VVNLEAPSPNARYRNPKRYTLRVGSVAFDALALAGVDVVTMANNHTAVAPARGKLQVWMAPKP